MHINIDHDAPSALIQYEDRWNALNGFVAKIKSFIASLTHLFGLQSIEAAANEKPFSM